VRLPTRDSSSVPPFYAHVPPSSHHGLRRGLQRLVHATSRHAWRPRPADLPERPFMSGEVSAAPPRSPSSPPVPRPAGDAARTADGPRGPVLTAAGFNLCRSCHVSEGARDGPAEVGARRDGSPSGPCTEGLDLAVMWSPWPPWHTPAETITASSARTRRPLPELSSMPTMPTLLKRVTVRAAGHRAASPGRVLGRGGQRPSAAARNRSSHRPPNGIYCPHSSQIMLIRLYKTFHARPLDGQGNASSHHPAPLFRRSPANLPSTRGHWASDEP